MSDQEIPQPVIVDEKSGGIGIHLSYIRRDLDEMKKLAKDNWDAMHTELQELKGAYVTRDEFIGFQNEIQTFQGATGKSLENFITREEFSPIKSFVYGLITFVLIAVLGAILGLIIIKSKN